MHESLHQVQVQHDTTQVQTTTTIDEQVARYRVWLSTQDNRDASDIARESNVYAERATKIVEIGDQRIQSFAPFRYKYSALQTITGKQALLVSVMILVLVLGCIWNWQLSMLLIISAIAVSYMVHLVLDFVLALLAIQQPSEEYIDEAVVHALHDADWPRYTILCPLYREAQVVPQFVTAMKALDYPADRLQIMFLTEADDAETRNAILAMRLPAHFHVITVPDGSPRTKPRACNYGLIEATGQYVVIYDAEDVPDPLQLKKVVLTFANHGRELACVQAKLSFYNPQQNLLTRWFTAEYSWWFDLILPGLQQSKLAMPLGGTSNHFPTQTLRALGAWDAFNVTEDCDLGLRLAWFRLITVVLDSTTYEEANSRFKNWIRQRSRWIKGYMQTYLVHMREPIHYLRKGRFLEFASLQLIIGGKAAVLLINPLMWILLAVSGILHLFTGEAFTSVLPRPTLYICAICLMLGNFFYGYIYLLGCMRRQQYPLVKWMLLIPLYWIMGSIAAYMALYQLITKPHYWEKTVHGLHLQNNVEAFPPMTIEETVEKASEMTYVPLPEALQDELVPTPVQRYERLEAVPVASVQASIETVEQRKPAFSMAERMALRQAQSIEQRDPWMFASIATAAVASVASCRYYYMMGQSGLYNESMVHQQLARRVFDGAVPFNLAKIGGIYLPLPHLLMLPFAWNGYLWYTGLAGVIPSMLCYVVSALAIFLLARRLTKNSPASFMGSLIFTCNPALLYLQSTALNDTVFLACFTMSVYYFVSWIQTEQLAYMLWAGMATALTTLTRYEGWVFFAVMVGLLVVSGMVKRQSRAQIEGSFLVFVLLAGFGICLWIFWSTTVFRDALYFLHSPYTMPVMQMPLQEPLRLYTYLNAWQSLRFYALAVFANLGPLLTVVSLVAVVAMLLRRRSLPVVLAALTLLYPLAFYVAALFMGQVTLLLPGALPASAPQVLFHVRYGVEMLPAAAILSALLLSMWDYQRVPTWRISRRLVYMTGICLVLAQFVFIMWQGNSVLQEGTGSVSCARHYPVAQFLAEYYAGGKVLQDTYVTAYDRETGDIKLRNVIDANTPEWDAALKDPGRYVNWIVVQVGTPGNVFDAPDLVAQHIDLNSAGFLAQFKSVVQAPGGVVVYYRQAAGLLHMHALPASWQASMHQCGAGG